MSTFVYNAVNLQIVRTNHYRREPVFSPRGTYQYTRFTWDLNCIFNPGATSYPGNSLPAVTDATIKHQLMEPRHTLSVSDDAGNFILQSPAAGYTLDANNGPTPISCTVQRIAGSKTWHVHYVLETCLQDCPNDGSGSALLSNEWSMTHDVDENYLTTRTVQGVATFRTDLLNKNGEYPDDFRSYLCPSIPAGFHRANVRVVATEDGRQCAYLVVDKQRVISYGSTYPATKIEAMHTVAGSDGKASIGHVVVRLWGHPKCQKYDLLKLGFMIVTARLGVLQQCVQASVSYDVLGKFVELQIASRVDVDTTAGLPFRLDAFAIEDVRSTGLTNAAGQAVSVNIRTDFTEAQTLNLKPVGDNISRGDYLGRAVAQGLTTPCALPVRLVTPGLAGAPTLGSGSVAGAGDVDDGSGSGPVVSVSVIAGPIPGLSTPVTKAGAVAGWTEYLVDVRWEGDEHVLQQPVAGPAGSACEFICVAAPTQKKIIKWTCERMGQEPEKPRLNTGDPNDVLLHYHIDGAVPDVTMDGGTPVWRNSGVYTYGVKVPNYPGEVDLILGTLPYLLPSAERGKLSSSRFVQGIGK